MKVRNLLILIVFIICDAGFIYGKQNPVAVPGGVSIIVPSTGEKAYSIAGEAFVTMWEQVTGLKPSLRTLQTDKNLLPEGNVVLIGSDAVNPLVHELIRSGKVESLGIVYGADNYRILSLEKEGRTLLILAGGCGRSTLYAVYDFFRRQAGVEYFWDGDVIPHKEQVSLENIDVLEKPHFNYRGLRYFAHRGLHRFQAEHWDLEDWKKEIDWLVKKRFNLFMLRTGTDDLFQRTFPDVPYPPEDGHDPDSGFKDHYDRTSFWPLKYRGELRKQVLQYARDRGLMHPEDVGTITHWYSSTPMAFFDNRPGFPVMETGKASYSFPRHGIWDIESQLAWDSYWKLTETHINEFGGGTPRLFHTIGLAERKFGSERANLQAKLYVYRKIQQKIRELYPGVPLLIASWDFMGWKEEEVRRLTDELDPENTVILDYLADNVNKVSYRDFGYFNNFPWIFGIIHSFANNSDFHGNYSEIIGPRLEEASKDGKCAGLVVWSEISHSDNYLLEYLARNSWQPAATGIEMATRNYCNSRYPQEISTEMNTLWHTFLDLSQSNNWGKTGGTVREPQFRVLTSTELINLTPGRIAALEEDIKKLQPGLKGSGAVLKGLASMAPGRFDNPLWQRDALDMARTVASNALLVSLSHTAVQMEQWRQKKANPSVIGRSHLLNRELLATLTDLLSLSDDFSMAASLRRLSGAETLNGITPLLNPHTELTLKGNAEGNYCRSHHYEMVRYVYTPELEAFQEWVMKKIRSGDRAEWKRPEAFNNMKSKIEEGFYETPLEAMKPQGKRDAGSMSGIMIRLEQQVAKLIADLENKY